MTARSIASSIATTTANTVSDSESEGEPPSFDDPADAAPSGFEYLVDSDGAYLADSDGAYLLTVVSPEPFTDALWLKASDLVMSDNAAVTSWVSSEGDSLDFYQSTDTKQPTYKATSLINSKPAVSFDGGDILKCDSRISSANTGSIWAIIRRAADTQYQTVFSQNNKGPGAYFAAYHRYATAVPAMNNISNAATGTSSSQDVNTLIIWSSNGTAISIRLNGTNQTVTDGTSGGWAGDYSTPFASIGGIAFTSDVFFFNGLIAEIGVCDSALNSEQIAMLEEYANTEYGI
jgi:hypothetical protein